MAITRAQQAKQMLQNGGRIGLAKGSRMQSGEAKESRKKSDRQASANRVAAATNRENMQKAFGTKDNISTQQQQNRDRLASQREATRQNIEDQRGGGFNIFNYTPTGLAKNVLKKINESEFVQRNNLKQRKNFFNFLARTDPFAFKKLAGQLEDQDLVTVNEDTITSPSQRIGASDFSFDNYLDFDETLAGSPDVKGIFDQYGYDDYLNRFEKLRAPDNDQDPILPIIPKATDGIGDNTEEEIPFQPNFRLLADGGRAGLAKGSRMQSGEVKESRKKSSAPTNPNKRRGAVDEKTTDPRITPGGDKPTRPIINNEGIGSLTTQKNVPTFREKASDLFKRINFFTPAGAAEPSEDELNIQRALNQKSYDDTIKETLSGKIEAGGGITDVVPDLNNPDVVNKIAIDAKLPTQKEGVIGFREDVATPESARVIKNIQNFKRSKDPNLKLTAPEIVDFFGTDGQYKGLNVDEVQNIYDMVSLPGQNRFMAAEGGMMSPEGGIMDLESGRQMYFLGKLVKKATRAVKKVADSPIGKIALGAALFGGVGSGGVGSFFGKGSFNPFKAVSTIKSLAGPRSATQLSGLGKILSKAGLVNKAGSLTASGFIGIPTIASYFLTDEEKEAQLNKGADIDDPRFIMANFEKYTNPRLFAEGGRIGAQEGGIMPRLNQLSGSVSSAEQMLQEINQRLQSAESSLGEGGGMQQPLVQVQPNAIRPSAPNQLGTFMGRPLNALSRPENNAGPLMSIPSSGSMTSGIPAASYANGGDVEPVAKKTMPLLDMDGKEMDLRAEGGFVPIGRMEKADDVPARLSKNEFVFTADAVRNAGDGDVDKGAEVMYNMMKNLESGGDVSEESQGLEGARNMFQTSQRLEEVL